MTDGSSPAADSGDVGGASRGVGDDERVRRPPAVTPGQAMVAVTVLLVVVFLVGFALGRTG